jgi:hypothetical protein
MKYDFRMEGEINGMADQHAEEEAQGKSHYDLWFGSKTELLVKSGNEALLGDVRFSPKADIARRSWHVR